MPLPVKLDDDLEQRLHSLAAARKTSTDGLVREAIRQFVDREENRSDFVGEAERSWEDFRSCSSHLTGEETRNWLKTWGTEAETEPPECHD